MREAIGRAKFDGHGASLFLSNYQNGSIAVVAECDDGIPWGTLTKWIDGLKPGEVAVDSNTPWDYTAILEATGLFAKTSKTLKSGFCTYPVYLYMG